MKTVVLTSIIILISANFTNAEEKAIQRWAIISSRDDESQKLADILFAELANDSRIELVERDEIAKISSEQELDNLSESESSKQRLKLLSLIKADRLIILSINSLEKPPDVRIVISESGQGARLKVLRFPFRDESTTVKKLVSEINKCNKKYSDGIKKIVAVAPLLPENISHKYDSLGIIYQELLESELIHVPGLAVLEIIEARKIAEELAVSGDDLNQRIVPILINGKYEIFSEQKEIQLELHARQNDKVLASVKKTIKQDEIVPFFKKIISETVLDKNSTENTFSIDQQYDWLVNQAENASQLALPKNAIGLREAALMIKPDNTRERLALLKDYYDFYDYRYNIPIGTKRDVIEKIYAELGAEKVAAYVRATEHIEFLVRNKKINREVAADLINRHRTQRLGSIFHNTLTTDKDGKLQRENNDDILDVAIEAQFEMDRNLFPLLKELELPKPNYGTGLANLQIYMLRSYLHQVNNFRKGRKPLDKCLYYLNEIMPDNYRTSYDLKIFFNREKPEKDDSTRITTEEWFDFLTKLSVNKKNISSCLGEFGFICAGMWDLDKLNADEKGKLAKRVENLMTRWEKLPAEGSYHKRNDEPIYHTLKGFYTELTGIKPKTPTPSKRKEKPDDWQTNPETWSYWGMPPMLGRVRFSKLDLKYDNGFDKNDLKFLEGIIGFDILWSWRGVWKLDKNLTITSLINEHKGKIRDVHYDGKYIWIQHEHSEKKYTYTVSVYSIEGTKIATMDKEFPDHSWSIHIMPYATCKILVVGCMRPHYRTWFATVKLVEDKLKFNPFFQAKKMPTETDPGDYNKETNLVFSPEWVHLLRMKNEKDNFILIGREGRNRQRWYAPPLALNIETMEIGILKTTFARQMRQNSLSSKDGILFHPGGIDTVVLPEKWDTWPEFKRQKYGEWTPGNLFGEISDVFSWGTVFMDDKYIYAFGRKCYRIDLVTLKDESLIKGSIPNRYEMDWVRISQNHGLIGFKKNKFYNIKIVDEHYWYHEFKTDINDNK